MFFNKELDNECWVVKAEADSTADLPINPSWNTNNSGSSKLAQCHVRTI